MYAVPNALDVLCTHGYHRLPHAIKDIAPTARPSESDIVDALDWLNHHLRLRLIETRLPTDLSDVRIGMYGGCGVSGAELAYR